MPLPLNLINLPPNIKDHFLHRRWFFYPIILGNKKAIPLIWSGFGFKELESAETRLLAYRHRLHFHQALLQYEGVDCILQYGLNG